MLLGLLATIILTLYAEMERELRFQLKNSSIYRVFTSEVVSGQKAAVVLGRIYEEEVMWSERYGEEEVIQVQQPLVSAYWENEQAIPIIAYGSQVTDFRGDQLVSEPNKIWFLSQKNVNLEPVERIRIFDHNTVAYPRALPTWVEQSLSMDKAVAIPREFVEGYLQKGFVNYTIANLSSLEEVKDYTEQISAYHSAENRKVKIVSSLGIIQNLEKVTRFQQLARAGVLIGCGVILACTLGSIAWLEYRQEAYLLALLRSFGTSRVVLQIHVFLENLLLVFLGFWCAFGLWKILYRSSESYLSRLGFETTGLLTIPLYDMNVILLAGLAGVLLSMIPITIGLRKPIGLILQ